MRWLASAWCVVGMLLCASVGSCNRSDQPAADGTARPKVAFVSNNAAEFWTIAKRGCEKAARDFDVDVAVHMPSRGTAAEQRKIIEDLLVRGVQGIAISPNDAENQAPFLNKVAQQVPLVAQDSDLPEGSERLCFIGTDNYEAGRAAGQLVKQAMPDGGRVVIFVGKLDVRNAVERRQGVMDELAGQQNAPGPELGKYRLLATMTDDVQRNRCKANAEDMLTRHGQASEPLCLVGLWAYNPPAMLSAVKERSGSLACPVHIVGFDEYDETLQGVKDGQIVGTIVQQPFEFGYHAVRILAGVIRGDQSVVPEGNVHYFPHRVITAENVDPFWAELNELKK